MSGLLLPKPKPGHFKRVKAARKRKRRVQTDIVRPAIFDKAHNVCVCCRRRPAQSMHEVKPKSLGGQVSMDNSIPVCGSGTTGCHGYLQQNKIVVSTATDGRRTFVPRYDDAKRWMRGETA